MHVGPGWYVGLAPLAGGRLNVGMALPMDGPQRSAADRFAGGDRRHPGRGAAAWPAQRLTPIRGASPIGHRVAGVAGPGWMLVGDAAGFIDPFTGEGIYRALRSARAAAEALAAGDRRGAADALPRRAPRSVRREGRADLAGAGDARRAAAARLRARAASTGRPRARTRLGSALGDCRPATDALSPALPGAGPPAVKSRIARSRSHAPFERIFPLAAEVERWPERLPHYRYVRRVPDAERGAALRDGRASRPDPGALGGDPAADPRRADASSSSHTGGVTRGMQVAWRFEPRDGGCDVSIEHDLELGWPLIGGFAAERVIGPQFIDAIAGRTLRRVKELAEAPAMRRDAWP